MDFSHTEAQSIFLASVILKDEAFDFQSTLRHLREMRRSGEITSSECVWLARVCLFRNGLVSSIKNPYLK